LFGLADQAEQGVQSDGAVAEPVGRAEPGEGVDGLGDDGCTLVIEARRGLFIRLGDA
jgi:hypothetical protein